MNLTKVKQKLVSDELKTRCLEALPLFENHIFNSPVYFASPQDFAKMIGESYNEKTYKVFYLMITFASFTDSKNKGCDDDPVTYLTYKIQLFRETQEARTDKPNSHDLLVDDMIDLRNYVLETLDIDTNKVVCSPLVQIGDMIIVQDCEYVVGVLGDWFNFKITVELNDE